MKRASSKSSEPTNMSYVSACLNFFSAVGRLYSNGDGSVLSRAHYIGDLGEGDCFELADGAALFAIKQIDGRQVSTLQELDRAGKIIRFEKIVSNALSEHAMAAVVEQSAFVAPAGAAVTASSAPGLFS